MNTEYSKTWSFGEPKNYSDKVLHPLYPSPNKCPICEKYNAFIGFEEDRKEFIIWKCRYCHSRFKYLKKGVLK
jgi:hypothetical protein